MGLLESRGVSIHMRVRTTYCPPFLPHSLSFSHRLINALTMLTALFPQYRSSTQMPKSVKKAFLAIFEKEGGMSPIEGESKWEELEKKGKILEETWG